MYRKKPEGRSITVAATVTLVYIGHATILLRVWRVSDAPHYPIGLPLAGGVWGWKDANLLEYGFDKKPEDGSGDYNDGVTKKQSTGSTNEV
ncbi:hypothetical protein VTO42DRAFT_718 [Malbranchea cinnamomea]